MTMTKEQAQRAYDSLIAHRRQNVLVKSKCCLGRIEVHHVIPTSMNGPDTKDNKVALLAKEHFMAHVYLWIIHHDDEFYDAALCALMNMHRGTVNGERRCIRDFIEMSEDYQTAREEFARFCSKMFSDANRGEKNSQHGKHWYKDPESYACSLFTEGEQPDGWVRGKHLTENERKSMHNKGQWKYVFNAQSGKTRRVHIDEVELLVSTGEWKRGHAKRQMSEHGKQNIRAAQPRKARSCHEPKNKGKTRFVNVLTGKHMYFRCADEAPDGYVKSSELHQDKHTADSRALKHDRWLEETQQMADFFSAYGYEAACQKFNVHMSPESMVMRFIRARKLYGIHFESQPGKRRKFKTQEGLS